MILLANIRIAAAVARDVLWPLGCLFYDSSYIVALSCLWTAISQWCCSPALPLRISVTWMTTDVKHSHKSPFSKDFVLCMWGFPAASSFVWCHRAGNLFPMSEAEQNAVWWRWPQNCSVAVCSLSAPKAPPSLPRPYLYSTYFTHSFSGMQTNSESDQLGVHHKRFVEVSVTVLSHKIRYFILRSALELWSKQDKVPDL